MNEDKKYYIGQEEIVRADIPKEGWISYTIMVPNMQGVPEEFTQTVTQAQFEAMKSETPYEEGQVPVRQWNGLLTELLGVLLKYDIQMGDRDFIINRLDQSLLENFRKANAKLFKRKHQDHIRLSQIDEVLKTDTEFLED